MRTRDIPKLKVGDTIRCSITPCSGEEVKITEIADDGCGCLDYYHEDRTCWFAYDGRGCTSGHHAVVRFYGFGIGARKVKLLKSKA